MCKNMTLCECVQEGYKRKAVCELLGNNANRELCQCARKLELELQHAGVQDYRKKSHAVTETRVEFVSKYKESSTTW